VRHSFFHQRRRFTHKSPGRSSFHWILLFYSQADDEVKWLCRPVRILIYRAHEKGLPVENELNRIINALPGWVWTAPPDGKVEFFNQRWGEYAGP